MSALLRERIARLGMYLSGLVAVVNISVIYLALPSIERALHAGIADQQWIVSIYPLMEGGFTLAAGTLGDLFGRKRILTIAVVGFTLATLACALALGSELLIVARGLQGIFGSALLSLPVAGLGAVVGPVLGGILVHSFAWPSVFYISVAMGVLVLFTLPFVDSGRAEVAPRLDIGGQVASVLALMALSFALIEGNATGWFAPPILISFGVFVALLAIFIVHEKRSAHPMIKLAYFKIPTFNGAALTIGILNFGWFGIMLLATLYLQNVLDTGPLAAGFYLMPSNVAFFAANQFSARLDRTIGLFATTLLALGASIIGMIWMLWFTAATPAWEVSGALFVMGLGWGAVFTPAQAAGMRVCDAADQGFAAGAMALSRSIFGVLGIAALGAVLAATMASGVTASLAGTGDAPATVHAAAMTIHHGGAFALLASPPAGIRAASLEPVLDASFAFGMRRAMVFCIIVTLVFTILIGILLRSRALRTDPSR
ncbi:MAG: MFS transporter [Candidatus Eremiobacteraeota bacterium]|nr:MFS transporter [Candidatus Eremiobacteraeota bacterium]